MCFMDGINSDIFMLSFDLEEFIKGYRCRICKVDLNVDNFGGLGNNHGIFCLDCINGEECINPSKILARYF
jgi:hypothetical protein